MLLLTVSNHAGNAASGTATDRLLPRKDYDANCSGITFRPKLLANDPEQVALQRHERGHLLLPVSRDVVGFHQPAGAVTEDTLRGFVCHLEISQRFFLRPP